MVHFPILPTNTSVGVMERREHRAESASIRRLLAPNRVVAYGAAAGSRNWSTPCSAADSAARSSR